MKANLYLLKSLSLTPITVQVLLNYSKTEIYELGAVMILFRGYMGTIFHTGDMRFVPTMITDNPILFPPEMRTKNLEACSIHVDELIFDNTYCDPIFKFPNRDQAFGDMKEIIEKNPGKRVYVAIDSIGKEELLISLAEHFETLIVVNKDRIKSILAMDFDTRIFTTNPEEGWIEVVRKDEIGSKLNEPGRKAICITATGWANISGYISADQKNYIIPYSLHSNFQEIESFVKAICPSILSTVVNNEKKKGEKIYKIRTFTSYMVTLRHLKQQGYKFLNAKYTRPNDLSSEYRELMDFERQQQIRDELGLNLTEAEKIQVNTRDFQEKHQNVFLARSKMRQGAKIKRISEHDESTINDLKNVLLDLKEREENLEEFSNSMNYQNEEKNSKISQNSEQNKEDSQTQTIKFPHFFDKKLNSEMFPPFEKPKEKKNYTNSQFSHRLQSFEPSTPPKKKLVKAQNILRDILPQEVIEKSIEKAKIFNVDYSSQNKKRKLDDSAFSRDEKSFPTPSTRLKDDSNYKDSNDKITIGSFIGREIAAKNLEGWR